MLKNITKKKGDARLVELGIHCEEWRLPYSDIINEINFLSVSKPDVALEALRMLCENDFFMFCVLVLDLPINHPYLLSLAYEVQDHAFENSLWLHPRDHWKSTLISFARTLWKFCKDPAHKVFLFSNSLKLAKPHFMLLKRTMESNELLKTLWDHVFWKNPEKEASAWTVNDGLFLKQNKLKDPSLAHFGLVDAMPTGGHPNERLIDDLVDLKNIGTYFMMEKVKEAYGMADNLSSGETTVETVVGTRYKKGDLYEYIEGMGLHYISYRSAEVDEKGDPKYGGIPVLLSKQTLDEKKIKQANIYWAQMLMIPRAYGETSFKVEHLKFYNELPQNLNYYILTDPATNPNVSTYKKLDFTAMFLIGAGAGRRLYVVDMIHDRIGLKEKWEALKTWHTRYNIWETGYEAYATQKDVEYFYEKMEEERFYFEINTLKHSKTTSNVKEEAIPALAEYFAEGKIWFPKTLMRLTKDRGVLDLVTDFIEGEYRNYPNVGHDDRLDALRRIMDIDIVYPEGEAEDPISGIDKRNGYHISPLDEDDSFRECYWGE